MPSEDITDNLRQCPNIYHDIKDNWKKLHFILLNLCRLSHAPSASQTLRFQATCGLLQRSHSPRELSGVRLNDRWFCAPPSARKAEHMRWKIQRLKFEALGFTRAMLRSSVFCRELVTFHSLRFAAAECYKEVDINRIVCL